jgi:hypothetical protein
VSFGTLVVDISDARTSAIMWRSLASSDVRATDKYVGTADPQALSVAVVAMDVVHSSECRRQHGPGTGTIYSPPYGRAMPGCMHMSLRQKDEPTDRGFESVVKERPTSLGAGTSPSGTSRREAEE